MDFNLILLVLVFIVGIVLIFKFIKKLIFAVISVFILVILVIAGIGGLVYLDFKSLSSQEAFNVKIVHVKGDQYLQGIEIPFNNNEPDVENVVGISNLENLDVSTIDKDSGEFVVLVEDDLFNSLIEGKEFNLAESFSETEVSELDLVFSDVEIRTILDSDTPNEVLINLIFEKSNIPSFLIESAKPIAEQTLNTVLEEKNLELKEVIFSLAFAESAQEEENALLLIQSFKDDQLRVYPDRLVFSLVKLIPASYIEENLQMAISE